MTGSAMTGIELCVFDAYGTLYDFNSAVARHRAAVGPKADALSEMWRSKQIQYTWLRNSMGAYLALDPFPEVSAMLDRLRRAGVRCAILSNGNPEMLEPMVRASGLAPRFEAVLSVDAVGVFKVDPKTYALVEARCGVKPAKVCFLSSNCWDAHGAARFGFNTVWVNRAGAPDDNLPGKIVTQVMDLSALPSLLGVA